MNGTDSMRASPGTFTIARQTEGAAAQMARSVSSIKGTRRGQATRGSWLGIRFTLETSPRRETKDSISPSVAYPKRPSSSTTRPQMEFLGLEWAGV